MAFDTLTHRPSGGAGLHRPLSPGRPFGDLGAPPPASTGCGGHAPMSHGPVATGRGRATVGVCPPRDFDFTDLGDGGTQSIRVAERIDCAPYKAVDLIVRVHTDASIASGCSISVFVVSDGFTTDDPSQDFLSTTLGQGGITFSGGTPPAAGEIEIISYTSRLGAMLAVLVIGVQDDPAGEACTARLSIELVLREC